MDPGGGDPGNSGPERWRPASVFALSCRAADSAALGAAIFGQLQHGAGPGHHRGVRYLDGGGVQPGSSTSAGAEPRSAPSPAPRRAVVPVAALSPARTGSARRSSSPRPPDPGGSHGSAGTGKLNALNATVSAGCSCASAGNCTAAGATAWSERRRVPGVRGDPARRAPGDRQARPARDTEPGRQRHGDRLSAVRPAVQRLRNIRRRFRRRPNVRDHQVRRWSSAEQVAGGSIAAMPHSPRCPALVATFRRRLLRRRRRPAGLRGGRRSGTWDSAAEVTHWNTATRAEARGSARSPAQPPQLQAGSYYNDKNPHQQAFVVNEGRRRDRLADRNDPAQPPASRAADAKPSRAKPGHGATPEHGIIPAKPGQPPDLTPGGGRATGDGAQRTGADGRARTPHPSPRVRPGSSGRARGRNGFAAFLKNGQRLTTATTMTLESDWQVGMRAIAARADLVLARRADTEARHCFIQNEP